MVTGTIIETIEITGKILFGGVLGDLYIKDYNNVGRLSFVYLIEKIRKLATIKYAEYYISSALFLPSEILDDLLIVTPIDSLESKLYDNFGSQVYLRIHYISKTGEKIRIDD